MNAQLVEPATGTVIHRGAARRVFALFRRYALVLRRNPARSFDVAVWPLLDVVLFGSLGVFIASENEATRAGAAYLLAGIVMFHVLYQVQITVATGFMDEAWSRNVLNVMVTPVSEGEYVAALGLFGLAKTGLALVMLSLASGVMFGFDLGEAGWVVVPVAAVLMVCGWAIGIAVVGLMLRWGNAAEILAWGLNFLTMALSGVFYPPEALPGPLPWVGRALPTTLAFEELRRGLDGEAISWGRLGLAAIGAVAAGALGLWFCARMLRGFRNRGLVTRYS